MLAKVAIYTCVACLICSLSEAQVLQKRSFLDLFSTGPKCNGCPPLFCDDDPAIIHGYCCGCASFIDHLPVYCSPYLQCPANNYLLCQQYNYMLSCCCSKK